VDLSEVHLSEGTLQDVLTGSASWTVITADNRDVLPGLGDKSVAHVITDPPYEAEAHTRFRTHRAVLEGRMASAAIDFEPIDEDDRTVVAAHIVRISGGWALAFCQIEGVTPWRAAFVAAGAKWRRAQIWVKPDSAPQFTGDRPAQGFEAISSAWCGVGKSKWNGGGARGVYTHCVGNGERADRGEHNPHPTTKPLPLMLELVELFTDPGELILDPFCGSGTTGVACLRLGRRFIGIERDEKYAEVARERMRAESRGLSLTAARSGQTSIFDVEGVGQP
jgi:site-specific DNA-methyltransferase (adenine-specific)